MTPTVSPRTRDDLSRASTPGVARVCTAIAENPEDVHNLTIERHTVAVVTDGSAVLGLGDIGAAAVLPVMEGKARFTQLAGADAWPVCLDTQDTETIIEIEARLREMLDIPVLQDDQHGTAVVTLTALTNALRVVGRELADVRIVVSGVGAAGNAIIRLLHAQGARRIIGVDREGAVHAGMQLDREADPGRAWIADDTNPGGVTGSLKEVLAGTDVFIGVSAPHLLTGEDTATTVEGAIVCAMADPVPEVDPAVAPAVAAAVQAVAVPSFKRVAQAGAQAGAQDGRAGE